MPVGSWQKGIYYPFCLFATEAVAICRPRAIGFLGWGTDLGVVPLLSNSFRFHPNGCGFTCWRVDGLTGMDGIGVCTYTQPRCFVHGCGLLVLGSVYQSPTSKRIIFLQIYFYSFLHELGRWVPKFWDENVKISVFCSGFEYGRGHTSILIYFPF